MPTNATEETIGAIDIRKERQIAAQIATTFEAVLAEMGPESEMGEGHPFPMVLEPWPGGRWYRDLGQRTGHLWGHVQVIKPPGLLEICGPLFMSYPAISHLQYRLTEEEGGTRLQFTHTAIGLIIAEHREGVNEGWEFRVNQVRKIAERKAGDGS